VTTWPVGAEAQPTLEYGKSPGTTPEETMAEHLRATVFLPPPPRAEETAASKHKLSNTRGWSNDKIQRVTAGLLGTREPSAL